MGDEQEHTVVDEEMAKMLRIVQLLQEANARYDNLRRKILFLIGVAGASVLLAIYNLVQVLTKAICN